ncbi:MAG: type VII secretion protein EccCb [Solirubrobacteraceae bacterium]
MAPPGLRACIGLLDRPSEQRQDPFALDLAGVGGHLAVIGAPQTGKSTLLRTLLAALMVTYRPSELRAYALDFGGGLLRAFGAAPHFGGVAGKRDPERVRATISQIRAMIHEREACFRELGIDSMAEARERRRTGDLTPEQAADVLLVIDNWAALLREYEDLTEDLTEIAAAGLHHGVHLVITAGRSAEIRPAIREAFGTRLELRLNDPMESDFGRKVAESVPADAPGRGVTPDGLHFQVALPRIDGRAETAGLSEAIGELARTLADNWDGLRATPVRVLPEQVALEELPQPPGGGLVLAIEELTLAPVALDPAAARRPSGAAAAGAWTAAAQARSRGDVAARPGRGRGKDRRCRRQRRSRAGRPFDVTRRAAAIVATGLLACLWAAGCGSSASDSPTAAAKRFVGAVTHDDRGSWCEQIGESLLVAHKTGGLAPRLLSLCKTSDVFEITGSCDREAVISGASVTGDSVHGDRATVTLSSGATLGLQRSDSNWYVTSISGGTGRAIKQGRCAGAGA